MKQEQENYDKECIFCQIANGEIQAHTVFENDSMIAFLDRSPIREGHCQLIPKHHYETFDSMPPELSAEIVKIGQRIATVLKAIYEVERIAFIFSGSDIAHTHAHLFPIRKRTDVTSGRYIKESADVIFSGDHLRVDSDTMAKVQQKISHLLSDQNVQNATYSAREVVLAFWQAMETNDFAHAAQFLSEDFEGHWPQSS